MTLRSLTPLTSQVQISSMDNTLLSLLQRPELFDDVVLDEIIEFLGAECENYNPLVTLLSTTNTPVSLPTYQQYQQQQQQQQQQQCYDAVLLPSPSALVHLPPRPTAQAPIDKSEV